MGVLQGNVIARAKDGGGLEISTDGGKTWSAISGGGSGFTSDVIIQQPNSASAQVNTLELKNQFVSNTAGSETADWDVTVPVVGAQTTLKLGRANLAARQTATTAGATDSIAVNPRADLVVVTLGVDATSLTFTGLSLDADYCYIVCGDPVIGNGSVVLRLNGDVAGWSGLLTYARATAAPTTVTAAAMTVVDSADVSTEAAFLAAVRGVTGKHKQMIIESTSVQGGLQYSEHTIGISGGTADVASIVLSGGMKAGSVIAFRRGRAVAS